MKRLGNSEEEIIKNKIKEYFISQSDTIKQKALDYCNHYIAEEATDVKLLQDGLLTPQEILNKQINYFHIFHSVLRASRDRKKEFYAYIKEIWNSNEIQSLFTKEKTYIQKQLNTINMPDYTIEDVINEEKNNFINDETVHMIAVDIYGAISDVVARMVNTLKINNKYANEIKNNINNLLSIIKADVKNDINIETLYKRTVKRYIWDKYKEDNTEVDFHKEFNICWDKAWLDDDVDNKINNYIQGIKEGINNVNTPINKLKIGESTLYKNNLWEDVRDRDGAFTIINGYYKEGAIDHYQLLRDIQEEHREELAKAEQQESTVSSIDMSRYYGRDGYHPVTNQELEEREQNNGEHFLHLAFGYIVKINGKRYAIIDRAGMKNYTLSQVINVVEQHKFAGIFSVNETLNKLITRVR